MSACGAAGAREGSRLSGEAETAAQEGGCRVPPKAKQAKASRQRARVGGAAHHRCVSEPPREGAGHGLCAPGLRNPNPRPRVRCEVLHGPAPILLHLRGLCGQFSRIGGYGGVGTSAEGRAGRGRVLRRNRIGRRQKGEKGGDCDNSRVRLSPGWSVMAATMAAAAPHPAATRCASGWTVTFSSARHPLSCRGTSPGCARIPSTTASTAPTCAAMSCVGAVAAMFLRACIYSRVYTEGRGGRVKIIRARRWR